jgi:hypothetical protein
MNKTLRGVSRDLCRAEQSGLYKPGQLAKFQAAVRRAEEARAAVHDPMVWGSPLQSYVKAVVSAERIATQHHRRTYGYADWRPNRAQGKCEISGEARETKP